MSHRRRWAVLSAAVAVLAGGTVAMTAPPASAVAINGAYHAVTPTRVLDTRHGTGAPQAAVAAQHSLALSLGSAGPLPAAGSFSATVLNVTVTGATAPSVITVYPDGAARPTASNLNVPQGGTIANLVVTRVPADGIVRLFNGATSGSVQLIADVAGYYTGSDAPNGQGAFGTLPAPKRLLDTRNGTGAAKAAIPARGTVTFTAIGNGVPADASAAVLNVTVVTPTGTGDLKVYPAGAGLPGTSNLNFVRGQTVPNLVAARLGSAGRVSIYNDSTGSVQVIADIAGYFQAGDPLSAGTLGALAPVRLLDTRDGIGVGKGVVSPMGSVTFQVTGRGGVPRSGVATVALNVTAVGGTASGFLSAFAQGSSVPAVSNLNYARGQNVPNLVFTRVGPTGQVTVFNNSHGTVNVLADVAGYVLTSDVSNSGHGVPPVSVSRYIRDITGNPSTDASTLAAAGCADAQAGSKLVLLDIGAQSISDSPATETGDHLDALHPGVRLTTPDAIIRLTYPHLVADLQAYIDGFNGSGCASGNAIVAIGTNNDGDFTNYTAAAKGADWANEVVLALNGGTHVGVAGADDIEAGFASTAQQASDWEVAYLNATAAVNGLLIDNGSLDSCPTTYGSTAECGPVTSDNGTHTYTRADYVQLTRGNGPARIAALPQVYFDVQAVQWANLDASANGAIAFAGSLTQQGMACGSDCSMTPLEGFAALYHAISTVVDSPYIQNITDLISS